MFLNAPERILDPEIELADGTEVHAYKHIDTRRYIYLDDSCQAYLYENSGRYGPEDPARALRAVFCGLARLGGRRSAAGR